MIELNAVEIQKRKKQFGGIQTFLFPLIVFGVIAFAVQYSKQNRFETYAIGVFIIFLIGTVNFFYFRKLDINQIDNIEYYKIPIILVIIATCIVVSILLPTNNISSYFGNSKLRLFLSLVITCLLGGIGIMSYSLSQRNALRKYYKLKTYGDIKSKLTEKLHKSALDLIAEQKEQEENIGIEGKIEEEMLYRLIELEKYVTLIALNLSVETYDRKSRSAQVFRYFSLAIGPLLSAIFSSFFKQGN